MEEVKVKVVNAKHALAILKYLEALGYKPCSSAVNQGVTNAEGFAKRWLTEPGALIGFDHKDKYTSWSHNCGHKHIPEADFLEYARKHIAHTITLNDTYVAEITEDGVKVGCQTFPFSKVFELAEAIKEFRKNK